MQTGVVKVREGEEKPVKIWLFAGTTEGNLLADRMAGCDVLLDVSVATEYGREGLPRAHNIRVCSGRLTEGEMTEQLKNKAYSLVLDATHPYAREVSENIKNACKNLDVPLIRILREPGTFLEAAGYTSGLPHVPDPVWVDSIEAAVEFLKDTKGTVLVTTGSKELRKFTELPGFEERVYARVLSLPEVVKECAGLGFYGEHLIAMQGPFSKELNLAMLHSVHASWLVTKESGRAGGFFEKAEAAKEAGAGLIIIGRPKENGISPYEALQILEKDWGISLRKGSVKVSLVGAGPGNLNLLTAEAREALERAQLIAGAPRLADSMEGFGKAVFKDYRPEAILDFLQKHPEYHRAAVVLSGDTGFYSGAKKLVEAFEHEEGIRIETEVLPGISSMNYFFARQKLSWEDVRLLSLHGRDADLLSEVQRNSRVFVLAGGREGLKKICQRFISGGLPDISLTVGENLSLPDEKIYSGSPEELKERETGPLFVVYIENRKAFEMREAVTERAAVKKRECGEHRLAHGLPDDAFLRGNVPMTKMEVRTVSVSKLGLCPGAVVYDVGAGTGSVSVECAGLSETVTVYAVERNPEALKLLKENRQKFCLEHLNIIEGEAPEALRSLPAPTHVFIGGSGGKLKEIVEAVLKKNPHARFVVNLITLESMASVMELLKSMPVSEEEIVQISVARDKKAGRSHLMIGQNPVWIVSFAGAFGGAADV